MKKPDVTIPEPYGTIMDAVCNLDRLGVREGGGAFVRPYIPGEFWPCDPPASEAHFFAVRVHPIGDGVRAREQLRYDKPPFTEESRRQAIALVDAESRRMKAS